MQSLYFGMVKFLNIIWDARTFIFSAGRRLKVFQQDNFYKKIAGVIFTYF